MGQAMRANFERKKYQRQQSQSIYHVDGFQGFLPVPSMPSALHAVALQGANSNNTAQALLDIILSNAGRKALYQAMEKGADANAYLADGCTIATYLAARPELDHLYADCIETLLDNGARPALVDAHGKKPLEIALDKMNTCVYQAIDKFDDMMDMDRRLLIAAAKGEAMTVKNLIARGASVNAIDDDGFTVLMRAAQGLSLAVIKLVLAQNPDFNKGHARPRPDMQPMTTREFCASFGQKAVRDLIGPVMAG